MLKDFPIYFDDTKLFSPSSWDESYAVVESTNQTEAGTDQIIVTRYDKLSVSASKLREDKRNERTLYRELRSAGILTDTNVD
jgi:hypothetical protein